MATKPFTTLDFIAGKAGRKWKENDKFTKASTNLILEEQTSSPGRFISCLTTCEPLFTQDYLLQQFKDHNFFLATSIRKVKATTWEEALLEKLHTIFIEQNNAAIKLEGEDWWFHSRSFSVEEWKLITDWDVIRC